MLLLFQVVWAVRHGHIGDAFFDLDAAAFLCSQLPNIQPTSDTSATPRQDPLDSTAASPAAALKQHAPPLQPKTATDAHSHLLLSSDASGPLKAPCAEDTHQSSANPQNPAAAMHPLRGSDSQVQQAVQLHCCSEADPADQDSMQHDSTHVADQSDQGQSFSISIHQHEHQVQQPQPADCAQHEVDNHGHKHSSEQQSLVDNMQQLPQRAQTRRQGRANQSKVNERHSEPSTGSAQLAMQQPAHPDTNQALDGSEETQCSHSHIRTHQVCMACDTMSLQA